MAVCFWYPVKCDLSIVRSVCTVALTGQVTFSKVPEKHGHVYLVGLYKNTKCELQQYNRAASVLTLKDHLLGVCELFAG